MEIYAPLAHLVGISSYQVGTGRYGLSLLNEVEFYKITHLMTEKRKEERLGQGGSGQDS